MFVCTIQLELPIDKISDATRLWKESVLPELQEQKGWQDAAFSVDHTTGNVRIFTLWQTQDQANWFESNDRLYNELGRLLALGVCQSTRVVYPLGESEIAALFGRANKVYFN